MSRHLRWLVLACAFADASVYAQERPPLWYVGAQATHVQPDSARDASNGAGVTLFWGKPIGAGFNAEVNAFGHVFHARADGQDVPAYGAGIDLNYTPSWTHGRLFALLGGGGVYERLSAAQQFDDQGALLPRERDPTVSGFARVGVGFYLPGFQSSFDVIPAYYRNHWLLRADLSWYAVLNDRLGANESFAGDVRLNIGVVFARTRPRPGNPPPMAPPEPEIVPVEVHGQEQL